MLEVQNTNVACYFSKRCSYYQFLKYNRLKPNVNRYTLLPLGWFFVKYFVNILETIYDYSPILIILVYILNYVWDKVFKNEPCKTF